MKLVSSLTVLMHLVIASAAAAQAEKKAMTVAIARQVIAAAAHEAIIKDAPGGAIAVVDGGGHIVAVERLDNTFPAGANISIGKARTAALFKRPTKLFEDAINQGRTAMAALADFTPLQGGVPVVLDGEIIGAVGVSGAASAQQDEEFAIAGAKALGTAVETAAPALIHLPAAQVKQAFEQGMPLTETANYKVYASHRDGPGIAEVHETDTDIIYMLEGSATLVTGGSVVAAKTIAPEEIRGREISGGVSRFLAKGDVIVIPHGTPHWFKEVTSPINYDVVKVRAAN